MKETKSLIATVTTAVALGVTLGLAGMSGPASGTRRTRADIADRDPTLYKGDWQRSVDGGFRFTAFGHAYDVNGKAIRLIEVDSVACEVSRWGDALMECTKEFKKQNHLE